MDNSLVRRGIGLLLVLVAAVLAVWLLWPDLDTGPEPVAVAPEPRAAPIKPPPQAASATTDDGGGEAELVIIDDAGNEIPRTEKCQLIEGWNERHVPHFTIADNMRDQAMLFTEDDLACLTASNVPPFVLQYAEMHMKRERTPK